VICFIVHNINVVFVGGIQLPVEECYFVVRLVLTLFGIHSENMVDW
jgi:hypothetical protein